MVFCFFQEEGLLVKKAFRIKKKLEISAILDRKQSVGDACFSLSRREVEGAPHFRFAVSVPKKFGGAVARNRVKRQVREIVRANHFRPTVEFFVIVRAAANTKSFQELKTSLEKIFAKAKILEVRHEENETPASLS